MEKLLFDNFQFSKDRVISSEEMEKFIKDGLVEEKSLIKRISLSSIVMPYLK